ncbi:MAG TPA: 2-amino-4-hydroxy-6-hydroxymethyldihydropteridine diphosphokinase [Bacteroidia bacterium]|nr:2-amino-4-hydroxy-6-hydroxymethyldihydropteridine diphosphokinase [Bacteroidia bacterium]
MNSVFIIIGGNLGNRFENIVTAEKILSENIGKIIFSSSIYESAPWGFQHEKYFLNKVVCIETQLSAYEVLSICLKTEKQLGRIRENSTITARTIDIDILFFNDEIIQTENLIVPHPKLHLRKFVLAPLAEIAGDLLHPIFKKNIHTLLFESEDILEVKRL